MDCGDYARSALHGTPPRHPVPYSLSSSAPVLKREKSSSTEKKFAGRPTKKAKLDDAITRMRARQQEHDADMAALLSLRDDADTIVDHERTISEQASTIAELKAQLSKADRSNNSLRLKVTDLDTMKEDLRKLGRDSSTALQEVQTRLKKTVSDMRTESRKSKEELRKLKNLLDEYFATPSVDVGLDNYLQ